MKRTMALLICIVMLTGAIFILTGCFNPLKEYVSGDFTYKKFGNKRDWYAEITGLSEQGKTKGVIIIPETIDDLPVKAIRDRYFLMVGNGEEKWESEQLTTVYFVNEIPVQRGCWRKCSNLQKVFVVNATIDNSFYTSGSEMSRIPLYVFKDLYDLEISQSINKDALSNMHTSNVTYYYNYSGAPNGGCYWIDQVDVGNRITFIPSNPTPQDNGYKFAGWHTDKECTNRWDFAADTMLNSGELDLYAKWIN